tara:strand:+ start:985 stop:1221 length:237 start_codon:yes stop_codon:yes gene_type:complete
MTLEEYEALMAMVRGMEPPRSSSTPEPVPSGKPKRRRRSKYQIELGKQLKMLRKKHPRTKITALMKKAHRLTRKKLKK